MSAPSHIPFGLPLSVLAVCLALGPGPLRGQRGADPVPNPAMRALASHSMATLRERDGTELARSRILSFNLDRYFTTYPTPEDDAETGRLLRTADRITRSFAHRAYRRAAELAVEEGRDLVGVLHVNRTLDELLPARPTPWDELVFFPDLPPRERVVVEAIDLQAFHDTGFVWSILGSMAEDPDLAPPMAPEAVPVFAEGVNSYGLLVLRLGGWHAGRDFALAVASPHLREAEKTIAARARGETVTEPPPDDEGEGLFVDVTGESGVDFRHVSSDWIVRFRRYGPMAPTFSGGGVATVDFDGDRWPDVVACGGEGCRAFRNRGDGTFEDVTEAAGIDVPGEARMPVFADLDGDGDMDLFVTYAHLTNRLFENLGDGRFRDVTAESGLEREGDISGPAVAVDVDGDARLDLYVGNFGNYLAGDSPWVTSDAQNGQPNRLYRNLGGLRFADVTEESGAGNTGWAQALSHVDFDLDGDQDLYVANDFGSNELLENRGDGTFEPVGEALGAADSGHGMNVAFADLDDDLRPDVMVTNIWGWSPAHEDPEEYNTLLVSSEGDDGPRFEARRLPAFFEHDSGWSWAGLFFDRDNDGDDDLFVTNGHSEYGTFLQYRRHPSRPDAYYPINNGREPNLYYESEGGVLSEPSRRSGAELDEANSRSLALFDYDRDGDLDLAITTFHGPLHLFSNEAPEEGNHWLSVALEGDPERGSPRDPVGAQVVAHLPDGETLWRTLTGGEGYLGMSERRIHLGLGSAETVDLEIRWPGGEIQSIENVPGDRRIRIVQGKEDFEVEDADPEKGEVE